MNEDKNNSNITQIALVALLVVASFFIGILSSRVKQLEINDGTEETSEVASANTEVISIDKVAEDLGLDLEAFTECLNSEEVTQRVDREMQFGVDIGVTGTPGNFLVDTQGGYTVFISGAYPFEAVSSVLSVMQGGNRSEVERFIANAEDNTISSLEVLDSSSANVLQEEDFIRGSRDARYVLFEYSDYECSFCKIFHSTAEALIEEYEDTAWVYRQFPIFSEPKSKAAICAGQVGGNDAFWAFSDAVFGL